MKYCLSAMIRYGVFLILLLLTFGCRKDLCYDHELHSASVKTVVAADWEQEWERAYDFDWEQNWNVLWGREYDELRPDIAAGIRALVYSDGGGFSENNLPADGGRLPMKEGVYSLLFYNNDTEYILFNDLTTSASASATTRTRTRGGLRVACRRTYGESAGYALRCLCEGAFCRTYVRVDRVTCYYASVDLYLSDTLRI